MQAPVMDSSVPPQEQAEEEEEALAVTSQDAWQWLCWSSLCSDDIGSICSF